MGTKTFAAVAGLGFLTVMAAPLAYHNRDVDFTSYDTYILSDEPDGKHIQVISSKMDTIADIPLVMDENGVLVGHGIVKGDDFEVTVTDPDEEALFIHNHGAEKMWLGRDVVHVQPAEDHASVDEDYIEPQGNDGPGF